MTKQPPRFVRHYLNRRVFSFKNAFSGLDYALRTQPNIHIHLVATILVILLSVLLNITSLEWVMVLILVGMVWIAEIFNTAIEKVVDLCSPQYHMLAKISKDLAAAGVLVAAITAAISGCIIFIPHLLTIK
ncbi:MAG: diacylglycerol kinase family protein [Anaerolineae bacterium]|nr:diacylglycerol kinase family protein [Anaerolineae bacterium]